MNNSNQDQTVHISVLQKEVLSVLSPRPGENFFDGTCGGGGHTIEILKAIGPSGKVLCADLDNDALERTRAKVGVIDEELLGRLVLDRGNFADLAEIVKKNNFGIVNGALVDLGFSSDQLEKSGRGFSFLKEEPLDMRFSVGNELDAREIVNHWLENEITEILKEYGEERFARNISKEIIRFRKIKSILTTKDLVEVIINSVPKRFQHSKIHPATRTFQALRIVVNDELGNLRKFLNQAFEVLVPEGRIAVISFHSLEDRIVKNFFRNEAKNNRLEILTKKPIIASKEEISINPRSRSAKLRVAKKI